MNGMEYKFLFMAKGGGSANKTYLFQQTKSVLNPRALHKFLTEKVQTLGTSACPPYHLAVVIGGLSAEQCLKTVDIDVLQKIEKKGRLVGCPQKDPPSLRVVFLELNIPG